jgi:hypothetical protein
VDQSHRHSGSLTDSPVSPAIIAPNGRTADDIFMLAW